MKEQKSLIAISALLVLIFGILGAQARAANPSFTISATNVTISSSGSSGTGSSTFTLTSVNGYTGTLGISCYPTSEPAGATLPYCGGSAMIGHTLTANAIATGALPFYNVPVPEPVSMPVRRSKAAPAGLALAAGLLLGFGFRKTRSRWLFLGLFAACAFAGLATMSGCGGGNSVVTPGTYSYTIKAVDTNSNVVTSTFNVTVP
ncbi:MAG: hypothetical protein ABR928_20140 [Terracidiphilus sp.]